MKISDFRSDTVTRPTQEMRRAMAECEVGDDVYGEDPTVNRLQERAAELTGQEAALFVPSGSMGNQIAVHLQTRPGDEVLVEENGHTVQYELGGMAALSGAMPRTVTGDRGLLTAGQVEEALRPDIYYLSRTSLLILENTHNMAGGTVWPVDRFRVAVEAARNAGLSVHLDGARIFNAAASRGGQVTDWTSHVDSVMFCLSKGLGAPVGSLLCGSEGLVAEARRVRKMLGGGMRQAGVLAAAGLLALEDGPALLAEDHRRASALQKGLSELPGIQSPPCETNIVLAELEPERATAHAFVQGLKERGVLAGAVNSCRVRFVTHRDLTDEDVDAALTAAEQVVM